jgi:hypothetical protein
VTNVIRPTASQTQEVDRQLWHNVFNPTFGQLVALGYVAGAAPLSYGSTVEGLQSTDGEVRFCPGIFATEDVLAADTVYLYSSSGSDVSTYTIHGIDGSGDFSAVQVTATGTTALALPGTWNHIQRVISDGADNVGTVYASTQSTGAPGAGDKIQTVMVPGTNYAVNPVLMCPNDVHVLIHAFDFSCSVLDGMKVRILANRQGRTLENFVFYVYQSQHSQQFTVPVRLAPGDYIQTVVSRTASGTVNAAFGMNGVAMTHAGSALAAQTLDVDPLGALRPQPGQGTDKLFP